MVTDVRSGLVLISVTAWQQILQLGPYVAGGILLAALLSQFGLRNGQMWLGRRGKVSIISGACLGCVSPLSTFGTAPVLLQLLQNGVSPGPVLAFLAASSMLNPQLFFLVWGGLGPRMALAQLFGILVLSIAIGVIASRFRPSLFLQQAAFTDNACVNSSPSSFSWYRLARDVIRLTEWIGLTFVVGVILAAALQVLIPPDWVARLMGRGHWAGVLLAGVLGVPLYTCGGSAVPVLAGLAQMGMRPAAALAFLLSGPATRVTALAAMGTLLNRTALMAYVVYIVIGAGVMGLLLG
jgi:uncharacterized membrane protein YraQ (UPF0718 family)